MFHQLLMGHEHEATVLMEARQSLLVDTLLCSPLKVVPANTTFNVIHNIVSMFHCWDLSHYVFPNCLVTTALAGTNSSPAPFCTLTPPGRPTQSHTITLLVLYPSETALLVSKSKAASVIVSDNLLVEVVEHLVQPVMVHSAHLTILSPGHIFRCW